MAGANRSERITYQGDSVRLDVFLTQNFAGSYTRSYWTNMIEHGYVLVNDEIKKSGYSLKSDNKIEIKWPEVTDEYSNKISVLHEDENVIVINKPAGMLVHSKGAFNPEYTVASYVAQRTGNPQSTDERAGIVHRLDRQTSGVMITAKDESTQHFLMDQFAERKTEKYYIAVVEGLFESNPFMIDVPLARSLKNPKTFEPNAHGKSAQTIITVIRATDEYSVVLLKPITGRTHQLRAHLKYMKHPIVGDSEYGAKTTTDLDDKRFLLHAYNLQLTLPGSSRSQSFIAPIPKDMTSYVHEEDLAAVTRTINT